MSTNRRSRTNGEPAQLGPARELLSVSQAADRLGTPERFIRRLVAERRLRFYKIGRYIKFDSRDIEAYVVAGMVDAHDGHRR